MPDPMSARVEFPGHRGDKLAARLDKPAGAVRGYALFAHCFTCSKDIFAARRVSQALTAHGMAVLRFDFTGLGSSEGEFANTDFSSNVEDLVGAADYLRDNYEAPVLLIGHSLGGAAVLAAAEHVPEARAVATIGAPSDPDHVRANFHASEDTIREQGQAEVTLAGRKFTITRQFLEDIEQQTLTEKIRGLKRSLLVFHSPVDKVVSVDHARRIYEAAKHPKSFISLDDADHLLSRREDAVYVADTIAAWLRRHMPSEESDRHAVDAGTVEVETAHTGHLTHIVRTAEHELLADEPRDQGGDDQGPNPYEFLLTGLGACTAMTLRMYADHKKIALDHVRVALQHARIHAQDCEQCETTEGRVSRITRQLELTGDLSQEEREQLLRIADKCPVHRTLVGEIMIDTDLVT